MAKCIAEIRIIKPGKHSHSIRKRVDPWFIPDQKDLVFSSPLSTDLDINEHLNFFYGQLSHHRKFLKQVQQDGVEVQCICKVRDADLKLLPDALLLIHKLHIVLRLVLRGLG